MKKLGREIPKPIPIFEYNRKMKQGLVAQLNWWLSSTCEMKSVCLVSEKGDNHKA